ncbi:MAG: hypothetical protein RLZZ15_4220 [Verrucomicrobiota bacterium]|jgi:hypothetical protein
MLAVPEKGVATSAEAHNCRPDALADWVEAMVAFGQDGRVSGSDIVDVLKEEEIYDNQSFAWEMVANVVGELDRRAECLGPSCPYVIRSGTVSRRRAWQDAPAHSFCLTLSLAKWYPAWARKAGKNFNEQGRLFEELTASALRQVMPSWNVHSTGWTAKKPVKISQVVPEVARLLCETVGEITPWVNSQANEAGLDLLCFRTFQDNRPGMPALMVQCASGLDYLSKAQTPDKKEWAQLVRFTAMPTRSLATPFAFTEEEFKRVCNKVDGPLFDRCRLLLADRDSHDWLPPKLAKALVAWITPRVARLPAS